MLSFFRRIRRRLVGTERVREYMLYAAGEILLVVIGILIALQINLWNENRKNRAKETEYLQNLLTDLNANIDDFQSVIERTTGQVHALNDYLSILKSGGSEPDSTILHRSTELMIIPSIVPRTTTYDDMVATGNINLIRADTLRQHIFRYYHVLADVIDAQDTNVGLARQNKMINVRNSSLDLNSISSHTAKRLNLMEIVEVSPFDPYPTREGENNPDRNVVMNVFSIESILLQYNISSYQTGLSAASNLRDQVRAYLAQI